MGVTACLNKLEDPRSTRTWKFPANQSSLAGMEAAIDHMKLVWSPEVRSESAKHTAEAKQVPRRCLTLSILWNRMPAIFRTGTGYEHLKSTGLFSILFRSGYRTALSIHACCGFLIGRWLLYKHATPARLKHYSWRLSD
jgi:hypothetical protein